MNNKIKNIILPVICALFIGFFSAAFWLKGETEYSNSERRYLAKFPELTLETISKRDDNFMDHFETYSLDQFPLRDGMRTIKALSEYFIFGKLDNNGYYMQDGHISKKEYPQNDSMLDYAAGKINSAVEKYMKGKNCNVYFSLIPDKNVFLADKRGVLSLDYEKFESDILGRLDNISYIDVFDMLSADDYYYTDQHWKQENIIPIASAISEGMGNTLKDTYETVNVDVPFYGTYYSQAAIPAKPDEIKYLTNETIKNCTVKRMNDLGVMVGMDMYVLEKTKGLDPYEMYLGGTQAFITIENPNAATEKELVVFRDSFGSSLIPLLAESYKKITVVDFRYIVSDIACSLIDWDSTDDVLFMYSTIILNNSTSMK